MVNLLPIILLWFISFDLSTQTKIEVEYDNYLDVITLNGKLYIPADSRIHKLLYHKKRRKKNVVRL